MASLNVLMPTYNRAQYVESAVDSILNQTFGDFKFLIMDDGSSDEMREVLKRRAAQDARIQLFFRPHRGLPATRNELLQLADSNLVAWIDSDDVAMPQRLQAQVDAMQADEDLLVLGTSTAIIGPKGQFIKSNKAITGAENVRRQMSKGCKVVLSSSIMRRDPILALGGFRLAFSYSQDFDLMLRASERGRVNNLGMVGLQYRWHANSVTMHNFLMQTLLADLARASHERRMAGLSDPVDTLTAPPDPHNDPIVDKMLGGHADVYRTLFRIAHSEGDPTENLRQLVMGDISRKQRRTCQNAILTLIRQRRFDWLSARGALRAVLLSPNRFVRWWLPPQG